MTKLGFRVCSSLHTAGPKRRMSDICGQSPGGWRLLLFSALMCAAVAVEAAEPVTVRPNDTGTDQNRVARIAVLQAGTEHSWRGNPGCEANFALLAGLAREAAQEKPDLIVFPEYAISGWPYPSEAAINGLAEPIPGEGPWYTRYKALAQETRTALLGWLVERDADKLYNCAFLIDADGRLVGKYRKVQANLGEQTWWGWSQGDSFEPIAHYGVRYGISICADMWFPETVRCGELLGANVILHVSIADDMEHIVPTRAFDSEVPIVMAIFNGGSYAVDAQGKMLGKLPAESPGWKVFALRPFEVRMDRKHGGLWIPKLGKKNLRNVEAYRILVDPSTRPPWTAIFFDNEGRPQTREQLLKRFRGRYDAKDPERPDPGAPPPPGPRRRPSRNPISYQ